MSVKPGPMNKRIIIQQKVAGTPARDAYGAENNTWEAFATVWASIEPLQGREFFAQQQVQSEITVRIRLRYLSGVTSVMRILHGSRILDIKSVIDPKERHAEMQLMCSWGVTNG